MPGSLDGAFDLRSDQFKTDYDPTVQLSTDPSQMLGQPLDLFSQMLVQLPQMAMKAIAQLLSDPGQLANLILQFPNAGLDLLAGWAGTIPGIGPFVEAIIGTVGDLLDLSNWFGNLELFLGGGIDFGAGGFNPVTAVASFVTTMLQPSGLLATLISGLIPVLQIPLLDPTKILNLPGLFSNVLAGFKGMFDAWFGGSAGTGTPAEVEQTIESIRVITKDGYTLQTFVANTTYMLPADLIGAEVAWAGVIGGGGKGNPGATMSNNVLAVAYGGEGGTSGGYHAARFDPATVGASLAIVIGTAAATNGANGTPTSIGSIIASTPASSGIPAPEGYAGSSSMPGNGGRGGDSWNIQGSVAAYPGFNGQSSATAAGGVGGSGGNGSAGAAGATGTLPVAGGGGGGGGGGRGGFGVTGYSGGNGGYPGGGSGGGGAVTWSSGVNTGGASGTPANGFAFIIWK